MTPDERDIYSRPGHLIRRLQQIAEAIFLAEAEGFDITPVQYSALLAIRNNPGIDQTTLMQIIAFDRSTIGEVVSRLERKKLVQRKVGARDRRTKLLYITPAGRRLIKAVTPAVLRTQEIIVEPLSRGERADFMRMMRHLVRLNNERSRAPLKLDSPRQRKPTPVRS
jgi:DNA-binding MarR family transcriptional regulator